VVVRVRSLRLVIGTDEEILFKGISDRLKGNFFATTYPENAFSAVAHQPMHEVVEPALLVLLDGNEIIIVVYKTLIVILEGMFGVQVVEEIPMNSF
jgi:hypothetical protein